MCVCVPAAGGGEICPFSLPAAIFQNRERCTTKEKKLDCVSSYGHVGMSLINVLGSHSGL